MIKGDSMWWFLAAVGVLIIVVLAVIAIRLTSQVRALEARQAKQAKERQALRQRTHNSIRILAQGMLNDQLTLTEGCIRISALLDSLDINASGQDEYRVIYQLAEETSHIPKLDAWKQLSKQQKINYDIERVKTEQKYSDFVKDAAKKLQAAF